MPEDELKACPFCNDEVIHREAYNTVVHPRNDACPLSLDDIEAEHWNTRRAPWVAVAPETLPENGTECLVIDEFSNIEKITYDVSSCEISSGTTIIGDVGWNLDEWSGVAGVTHYLRLDWLPRPETADK